MRATFYYDLGSPYAYLSAERISGLFAEAELEQPEWQPVLLGGLFARFDRGSWSETPGRAEGMAEIERRAAKYGLPPLAWPEPWPANTLVATISLEGGYEELARIVHPHPTISEAIPEAARAIDGWATHA